MSGAGGRLPGCAPLDQLETGVPGEDGGGWGARGEFGVELFVDGFGEVGYLSGAFAKRKIKAE